MVSISILLYISSALSQQYFLLGCRIQDEVRSALNSITEVVEAVDKKNNIFEQQTDSCREKS